MAALLPTPIDGCEQFTTKNKAMVREGVELSTDKVTELAAGVKVDAVERSKNAKGDNRLRITSPVAGWLSEKTVEPFVRYDFLVVGPTGVVGGWMLELLAEMETGKHALLLPDDRKPTWAILSETRPAWPKSVCFESKRIMLSNSRMNMSVRQSRMIAKGPFDVPSTHIVAWKYRKTTNSRLRKRRCVSHRSNKVGGTPRRA